MPDTVEYHRSFALYAPSRGQFGLRPGIQYVPQQYYDYADEQKNSVAAYRLADGSAKPVRIMKKPEQDFGRFATPWERVYSPLCGGTGTNPIVDENFQVIGHIGWFSPDLIFVQRGVGAMDHDGDGHIDEWRSINDTIERNGSVRVATTRMIGNNTALTVDPDPGSDVAYAAGVPAGTMTSFRLLANMHGDVQLELGKRDIDGLAPPAIDPFVLIGIAQLAVGIGKGLGRMLVRRIGGGMARSLPTELTGSAAAQLTRRGMGAAGPVNSARSALTRPVPRLGAAGRLELSVDEMGNHLAPLFKSNPEFVRLMKARAFTGDALKREVEATLRAWESRTGSQFEIVAEGQVQTLTGQPGNFASMQGNRLLIERQAYEAPAKFYEETVHELASTALGGRGTPHIWIAGNQAWNAQKILEAWISKTGSFDWFRQFLGGAAP